MKRLLRLAVIFVVLSMCVPSYAVSPTTKYLLIYTTSGTVKGVNNDKKASIPCKGYLVLSLNDSNNIVDANLIMYGTDSNTPKKQKVYIQLNKSSSTTPIIDVELNGEDSNFVTFGFWTDIETPFHFEGLIVGKGALKDIGLGTDKRRVASSLTGTLLVWDDMLFDADDNISGSGTFSASLYTLATKAANTYHLTPDEIIVTGYSGYPGIIQTLQLKKYSAAILTE